MSPSPVQKPQRQHWELFWSRFSLLQAKDNYPCCNVMLMQLYCFWDWTLMSSYGFWLLFGHLLKQAVFHHWLKISFSCPHLGDLGLFEISSGIENIQMALADLTQDLREIVHIWSNSWRPDSTAWVISDCRRYLSEGYWMKSVTFTLQAWLVFSVMGVERYPRKQKPEDQSYCIFFLWVFFHVNQGW